MPRLTELLERARITDVTLFGDGNVLITDVTGDSREAKQGTLFVAMSGAKADGAQYVADAIGNGCAAILVSKTARLDIAASVPVVRVADVRGTITALAAALYPGQPSYVFAVTGTDGKTSTADFTRQLAALRGHKAASIGTLGLRSPIAALNAKFPTINTSPEPVLLHRTLSSLSDAGVTHLAIEASSIGLDQRRVDGLKLAAAAFTNLTREHLDYHGTMEAYAAAKRRLFEEVLPPSGVAIANADDAEFSSIRAVCSARGITLHSFGVAAGADYQIASVIPHDAGLKATIVIAGEAYAINVPFYGAFQIFNMITAVAMLAAVGEDVAALIGLLPQLQGVSGRLEKTAVTATGAPVFVDYAHTPAALENVLKVLRPHTSRKLSVVFGCGGDRDQGKRGQMGAVAAALADRIYVTDDNPRSEDPAAIRAAILETAKGAKEISDRDAAIRTAVQELQAGDVLVVAGKGHETTQTIGEQVLKFSDQEHIRKAVGL